MTKKAFFLSLIFAFLFSNFLWAEPETTKTVKVGAFYDETGFFFQNGNGDRDGFGYEYLYTIAKYTNWKYEFIDGSWADLYQKLLKGEIDLLCDVSKTEERADQMLFPNETMGTETYHIFVKQNNTDIKEDNYASLNKKKFGVNKGSRQIEIFNNWCAFYNVSAQLVPYSDPEKCIDDVINGTLDGYLNVDMWAQENLVPTIDIGESDYFIAISKSRPDILTDLNKAQKTLNEISPSYFNRIYSKFFKTSITRSVLSANEKDWLIQKGSLVMGCIDNTMPFSDLVTEGEFNGVVVDIANYFEKYLEIPVRLVAFKDTERMKAALARGDIDICFPCYADPSIPNKEHFSLSEVFFSDRLIVVYKDSFTEDTMKTIATLKGSISQKYIIEKNYSDSKVLEFNTRKEYFDAVLSGEATACFGCGSILQYFINSNNKYSRLSYSYMDTKEDIILLTAAQNSILTRIIDKAIVSIDSGAVSNMLINAMSSAKDYSFASFVKNNLFVVSIITLIAILLIFSAIIFAFHAQKKNQKKLFNALNEAQRANAAKTEFLSRISHDIRTPINGILGMLQITEKNEDNLDKVRECHKKIEVSANHLLSLINDVLDMSRLETGKVVLEEVPFDMFSLVTSVKTITSPLEEETGIKVYIEDEDSPVHRYLIGSPLHVRQILVNLISNSIKYGKKGGKVVFSVKEISNDNEIAMIEFVVEDDGIGMSEEFQIHMFEAFQQENSGARTEYKGSGLGLAIVKKIVDRMGGLIKVHSVSGQGTKFTVQIPFVINHDMQIEENQGNKGKKEISIKDLNILLVEDNELNMEIAQFMLQEAGATFASAHNGKEAVELIRQKPAGTFDLILMDIMMPVMNGYEATRDIRSLHDKEKNKIPIIAMTANAFEEDKQQALKEGMNAHIAKPVEMDKLIETINEILS